MNEPNLPPLLMSGLVGWVGGFLRRHGCKNALAALIEETRGLTASYQPMLHDTIHGLTLEAEYKWFLDTYQHSVQHTLLMMPAVMATTQAQQRRIQEQFPFGQPAAQMPPELQALLIATPMAQHQPPPMLNNNITAGEPNVINKYEPLSPPPPQLQQPPAPSPNAQHKPVQQQPEAKEKAATPARKQAPPPIPVPSATPRREPPPPIPVPEVAPGFKLDKIFIKQEPISPTSSSSLVTMLAANSPKDHIAKSVASPAADRAFAKPTPPPATKNDKSRAPPSRPSKPREVPEPSLPPRDETRASRKSTERPRDKPDEAERKRASSCMPQRTPSQRLKRGQDTVVKVETEAASKPKKSRPHEVDDIFATAKPDARSQSSTKAHLSRTLDSAKMESSSWRHSPAEERPSRSSKVDESRQHAQPSKSKHDLRQRDLSRASSVASRQQKLPLERRPVDERQEAMKKEKERRELEQSRRDAAMKKKSGVEAAFDRKVKMTPKSNPKISIDLIANCQKLLAPRPASGDNNNTTTEATDVPRSSIRAKSQPAGVNLTYSTPEPICVYGDSDSDTPKYDEEIDRRQGELDFPTPEYGAKQQ